MFRWLSDHSQHFTAPLSIALGLVGAYLGYKARVKDSPKPPRVITILAIVLICCGCFLLGIIAVQIF